MGRSIPAAGVGSLVAMVREGAAGCGEGAGPGWGRAAQSPATPLVLHGSRLGGGEGHRIRGRWALPVGADAGVGEVRRRGGEGATAVGEEAREEDAGVGERTATGRGEHEMCAGGLCPANHRVLCNPNSGADLRCFFFFSKTTAT